MYSALKDYIKIYLPLLSLVAGLFLSFSPRLSHAQDNRLYTGIAFFPTIARSSQPETLGKFSLNGEFRIRFQATEWLAFESGPGFFNRGFRYKTFFKDSTTLEEWTVVDPFQMNFLTFPLRVRILSNGFTFSGAITPEIFINSNPSRYSREVKENNIAWQLGAGYQLELYGGGLLVFELYHSQPFQPIFRGYKFQNSGLSIAAIFPLMGPGGFRD